MKIAVDGMGGDNAPKAPVLGALRAKRELGVDITLVGKHAGNCKGLYRSFESD